MRTSMPEAMTRLINERGILIDQDLCRRQIALVDAAKEKLTGELFGITGLANPNSTQQLLPWLRARGYQGENLQAATVREEILKAQESYRRVLEIRLVVAKSPVKKYQSALDRVSADGRLRGTVVYSGAGKTGRWSAIGMQPQNIPRPIHPSQLAPNGTPERVLQDASDQLRHMIIAEKDKILVVSDLAGIEARGLAWLAGEQWALDAFARGDDLYIATYARVFGKKQSDVSKTERFIGKLIVLSMGYAGGLGAFMRFAGDYNMDLAMLYDVVWPISEQHHKQAEWMYSFHKKFNKQHIKTITDKYGDAERIVLAIECIKLGWRATNPNIVSFWKALEDAWRNAFATPGKIFTAGKCAFVYAKARTGPVMRMTLPSGSHIHHHSPRMTTSTGALFRLFKKARDAEEPSGDQLILLDAVEKEIPAHMIIDDVEVEAAMNDDVLYNVGMATDRRFNGGPSYMATEEGKWKRCHTYGGSLSETASQRISRDILAYNMPAVEEAGFAQVLIVHDEAITEANPDKTIEELNALLSTVPPWAEGFPLAAAGYATGLGGHYYKEA